MAILILYFICPCVHLTVQGMNNPHTHVNVFQHYKCHIKGISHFELGTIGRVPMLDPSPHITVPGQDTTRRETAPVACLRISTALLCDTTSRLTPFTLRITSPHLQHNTCVTLYSQVLVSRSKSQCQHKSLNLYFPFKSI